MSEPIRAYPLTWPVGWKRTESYRRTDALFKKNGKGLTVFNGVERVRDELARMGINENDVVISTNVETRLDGLPRSDRGNPSDPGVSVWWQTKTKERRCMAIDRYRAVADNLAAIAATLDAMRAIERHGGAQVQDRAFTGFTALPAPIVAGMARPWHEVFGIAAHTPTVDVEAVYRRQRSEAHPDREGGSHERMAAVNVAWDQFKIERGIA